MDPLLQAETSPRPEDHSQELAGDAGNQITNQDVVITGERRLNGIYRWQGEKNERPWYFKTNSDIAIWYHSSECVWAISDRSSIDEIKPDLYGWLASSTFDVTEVPEGKHWSFANAEGKWKENPNMHIIPFHMAESHISDSDTSLHFKQWTLSSMNSFWEELNEVKSLVKQNVQKMESVERATEKLTKVIQAQNSRERILVNLESKKLSSPMKKKGQSRRCSKVPRGWTLEDFIAHGTIEKASKVLMKNWLKTKQKQGAKLGGKNITVTGTKATLLSRIKALLEQENT